ncbi:MAG TPA: sigma-54 dependent transcriptional regulator [Kofleriaceae bacterium]|jgi:two-component system response regulator AtoC
MQRVLLLAPDDEARRALHVLLDQRGLAVVAAGELEAARRHLAAADCDLVVATDELARAACAEPDAPPVIAIAHAPDMVRELLDAGVADIIAEPDELSITLALRRAASLPRKVSAPAIAHALVGDGAAMQKLRATIRTIGPTRTTVLVLGETGTGKELVARAIHAASPRAERRFVAINCAAIPAPLLESELFGHVRGAFTDAVRDKRGLFEEADGGTLFLDEVGELPMALQAKLLRVLQDSEVRRVGETEAIKVDVRLVAATLRDLAAEVAAGRFREDLYYRIAVVPIAIPPLRERAEDIPQLARYFAERHTDRHRRQVALADDAIDSLARQAWPGNVRDLENAIERAIVLADGPVVDAAFLASVTTAKLSAPAADDGAELSIKKATRTLEQGLIRRALGVTQGNRTNAAKLLEISHRALLYKMKEYGIS